MLSTALAVVASSIAATGQPTFERHSEPIRGQIKERILGSSWDRGCPVHHSKLRLLELSHWGFDVDVHRGRLVVRTVDRDYVAGTARLPPGGRPYADRSRNGRAWSTPATRS